MSQSSKILTATCLTPWSRVCERLSGPSRAHLGYSGVSEPVDRRQERCPLLQVRGPQTGLGGQGKHADLALVAVAVDVEGSLTDLLEGVGVAQRRVGEPPDDQVVGLPGLAVVGEVRADDALEAHPQIAVVVLVQEARGRRAGHDGAAPARDEDAGAEGLAAWVLEDDVGVLAAGQLTDLGAEAFPLTRVLGVL